MRDNVLNKKKKLRLKRRARSGARICGSVEVPRVSVFRSNKHFYAQAIDDVNGNTLANIDGNKNGLGNNKENVKRIAEIFANTLKEKGISRIVFDRNGYLYHGVVAVFADTLRENNIAL